MAIGMNKIDRLRLMYNNYSMHSGILLFLIVGTIIGSRKFSYIHIPAGSIPLYVTELVLALLLVTLIVSRPLITWYQWIKRGAVEVLVVAYFLLGIIRFIADPDGIDGIRNFALIYYSLFTPLVAILFASRARLKQLGVSLVLASLVVPAIGIASIFIQSYTWTTTGAFRYLAISSGMYIAMALMVLVAFYPVYFAGKKRIYPVIALLVGLWFVLGLILTSHRAAWLAVAFGILFLICFSAPALRRTICIYVVGLAAVTWLISSGIRLLGYQNIVNDYMVTRVTQLVDVTAKISESTPLAVSDVGGQPRVTTQITGSTFPAASENTKTDTLAETDENIAWRLLAWRQLWQQVIDKAAVYGFGFAGELSFVDHLGRHVQADPHNSTLAVLFRLGFLGLFVFLALNVACIWRLFKMVRAKPSIWIHQALAALAASLVIVYIVSCFNVVLEGPFMGMFYWITIGCISALSILSECQMSENKDAG